MTEVRQQSETLAAGEASGAGREPSLIHGHPVLRILAAARMVWPLLGLLLSVSGAFSIALFEAMLPAAARSSLLMGLLSVALLSTAILVYRLLSTHDKSPS